MQNDYEDPNYADRLAEFELAEVSLTGTTATLKFADPLFFTSGGSCRTGLLADQITQVATQFAEVDEVVLENIEPGEFVFQP